MKRSSALVRYGGFVASVGTARVLGLLITSVTFPILVRRLGVGTYGVWSYVVAVCAFFDVIANPGLTTHAAQQVAAHRHDAAEFVSDVLVLRALSALIAIAALLIVAHFESRADVRRLLLAYGVAALCVGLTGTDFLLTAFEFFHARSILTLIQQALYAAGVLVLVRGPKDILWLPASILGSALVANLMGWFVLRRNGFRLPLVVAPRRWRAILVPSFHYAATTAMGTVYHRAGHLVVRWFLGDYALGLYAAAVRFVDLLRNFVSIALSVLMPRMALAAQTRTGLKRLVHAAVSAVAIIGIPLMLGTFATAHLVVPWVLGKNYVDAVRPVRLMAPFLLAAPMASLLSGTVLYALGRHRAYLISGTAGALTAVVLSLALVRVASLNGVCIAFVLAEAAVGITAYFLIPSELRDMWKNPMIAVAAFCGLLMMAAVWLVNSYSSRPLIVVAAGAAVYLISLAALGRKLLLQQFGEAR
ncbi:MAG: oligosaccharide flippase family protein [Candidatus Sulfotelmatobacter sp.]|jgi:O-antigen/teichoic acid export membrane protein